MQHCELDDICAGSLYGHIRSLSLRRLAELKDLGIDVRDVAAASQQGLHIAVFASALQNSVQIDPYAGIQIQIGFNEGSGAGLINSEFDGNSERAGPIDDSEINRFSLTPLVIRHRLVIRHLEDTPGGLGMNVCVGLEGFDQSPIFGHMRKYPQLNLRIVGGHEDMPRRGDKCFAYLPAHFGADGDILQVRAARR